MSEKRKAIRSAIKAVLMDQTVAGGRVLVNRPNPLLQRPGSRSTSSELPAILIYTKDGTFEEWTAAPREFKRVAEVVVELVMDWGETLDDDLDDFADDVLQLIMRDDSLGGLCESITPVTETMLIRDGGDVEIGAVVMTFDVAYFQHLPGEDDGPTDDFLTLDTRTSLDGEQDEDDRTGDTITIPQPE